jgi:hypothetical protein
MILMGTAKLVVMKYGQISGDEILPWASDECVIYEVVLIGPDEGTYIPGQYQGAYTSDSWEIGPRGIAVDKSSNIWAGCFGSMKYYYIRGSDGQILKMIDVSSFNHTPYGGWTPLMIQFLWFT